MISRKNRKNPVFMEVRKVLLGRTETNVNGHLYVSERTEFGVGGTVDGEGKIRFLGITARKFSYQVQGKRKKALQAGAAAMSRTGRRVDLKADRTAEACLIRTYIFYPVVLVISWEKEGKQGETLWLHAYTARAFSSFLAIRFAVKKFEKELPDLFERKEKERISFLEKGNQVKVNVWKRWKEWRRKRKDEKDDEVWNGREWVKK